MKYLLYPFLFFGAFASRGQVHEQIWALEQLECSALLKNDTIILKGLYSAKVYESYQESIAGLQGLSPYNYFTRENRQLIEAKDGNIISMGEERVIPAMPKTKTAGSISRQYSNVWRIEEGKWVLIARL
jgi:hypothetical protein